MSRRGLACLLCVFGLAPSREARADVPVTAELAYDAASVAVDCPDEAAFRLAVTRRLGRDPFVRGDQRRIAVTLGRTPAGYFAEVRTLDGAEDRGQRRIEADGGCAEVASAAALAVSIAIDPLVLTRPEPPPEPPPAEPAKAPRAEPARVRPRPAAAPAPEREPVRWHAALGAHGWAGAVPNVSVGASLGLALRSGAWSFGLGGFAVLPREAKIDATPLAVSAGVLGGAVTVCGHPGSFRLCGVGQFGALVARGHGVDLPRSDRTAHFASGASAGYVLRRGRFAVTPVLEAAARLRKTTLVLDGRLLWKAPTLLGSLGLELGFTL